MLAAVMENSKCHPDSKSEVVLRLRVYQLWEKLLSFEDKLCNTLESKYNKHSNNWWDDAFSLYQFMRDC